MTPDSPFGPRRAFGAIALCLMLLAGCESTPEKPPEPVDPGPEQPGPGPDEMSLTLPPSAHADVFADAEAALTQFDWMSATVILAALDEIPTDTDDSAYRGYLDARIAHTRGKSDQALEALQRVDTPAVHPALRYRIHNFRRYLLALQGNWLASAQLGAQMLAATPGADRAALQRSVWRDLARSDSTALKAARESADPDWDGWLSLALAARETPPYLAGSVESWRASHPGHVAAQTLPGGLGYMLESGPAHDNVALLLPLTGRLGPAGRAVRDGYLANYYRQGGPTDHKVQVVDVNLYPSAAEAYADAVKQGATLVIGPLSKKAVSTLAAQPQRPVPVLALNRVDTLSAPAGPALVQLSLAPEDEADGLATLAHAAGARRALVLRPAGAWGNKMEEALASRWRRLGGSLAGSVAYSGQDDYSAAVKDGLDLRESEERKRKVRDMLATNIEFTPRRRQDVDAIFMLARNSAEARAIKPLLAFHYAGNVPVYAPSSVYSGIVDSRDRDLDDTRVVEMPWLLGSNPSLRVAIAAGNTGSDSYTRLNALGADAYLLQTRINQLRGGPDVLLQGDTGLLSMNANLQLLRELRPARFDGGELLPALLD